MFGNLRFITLFDSFILPIQVDLSAHCFYTFSISYVLILRCNNTLTGFGTFRLWDVYYFILTDHVFLGYITLNCLHAKLYNLENK